jgi:hypothetical protein
VVEVVTEEEGVGAIPRISEMDTADFVAMFLAAIARARCLFAEKNFSFESGGVISGIYAL